MFGERLKSLRKKRGFTLQSLADKVGSTKSYIWELENKPSANPKADLVGKLAKELKVTIDYLVGTEDESDEESVFFREYTQLSAPNKKQLSKFMRLLTEEEDDD